MSTKKVSNSNLLFTTTIRKIMQFLEIANNSNVSQNKDLKKNIKVEIWNLSDDLKNNGLLINSGNFHEENNKK